MEQDKPKWRSIKIWYPTYRSLKVVSSAKNMSLGELIADMLKTYIQVGKVPHQYEQAVRQEGKINAPPPPQ